MKFLAAASLLATTVVANPFSSALSVRQPAQEARFTGDWDAQGTGCVGADAEFTDDGKFVTFTLPQFAVDLPGGRPTSDCDVSAIVAFPVGVCTTGNITSIVSGRVDLAPGSTASFHSRAYAISPSIGVTFERSDDRQFPSGAEESWNINDEVRYRNANVNEGNRNVNITLQGDLQVQPVVGGSGFIGNNRVVLSIFEQEGC